MIKKALFIGALVVPWHIYCGGLEVSYEMEVYFNPDAENNKSVIKGVNHVTIINNSNHEIRELYFHNTANHSFLDQPNSIIKQVRSSHGGHVTGKDSLVMRVI